MNEKDIMNDCLAMIKGSLTGYAAIISETDNPQLRQTLQEMRDMDEKRLYELYQTAKQKGYYQPAQIASQNDIMMIKNQLSQG
ncbi:spore coat protein [Sedimentibacter sp.]|uniref:spore coat protein n=1 Tax=Sedimentibacter sp. TaxID=1960295 RepID=UPI0028B1302D|nr:spore coat protein [Sedimentibacter sp.]